MDIEFKLVVCPACDGDGNCAHCGGDYVDPNNYDEDCPACGGDGRCATCDGAGEVNQDE